MGQPPKLSSGWLTYEVIMRDDEGKHAITPFSGALAISGVLPINALNRIRIVQELGWPAAKRVLTDDNGHPLIVRKDNVVWLLKCKPSCWRLYFYVWKNQ